MLKAVKKKNKPTNKQENIWETINIILLILLLIKLNIALDSNKIVPTQKTDSHKFTGTSESVFVKPFKGDFPITSPYGYRTHPILGYRRLHTGIDYGLYIGDEVKASRDGCVESSGEKNGYGNTVVVKHTEFFSTLYGHNSKLNVKQGDCVKQGDTIALAGNTGMSTAPHLHFEIIKNGIPVNPMEYLK